MHEDGQIDGFVQNYNNSSVLAMELLQRGAKPSKQSQLWIKSNVKIHHIINNGMLTNCFKVNWVKYVRYEMSYSYVYNSRFSGFSKSPPSFELLVSTWIAGQSYPSLFSLVLKSYLFFVWTFSIT